MIIAAMNLYTTYRVCLREFVLLWCEAIAISLEHRRDNRFRFTEKGGAGWEYLGSLGGGVPPGSRNPGTLLCPITEQNQHPFATRPELYNPYTISDVFYSLYGRHTQFQTEKRRPLKSCPILARYILIGGRRRV